MAREVVEVVETHIVPVDKPGMMIVEAPNGQLIQAPFEVFIAALLAQLPDRQQADLCDLVVRMTVAHNGRPDQFIDARRPRASHLSPLAEQMIRSSS
jgi:hypothetical protein